MVVPVSLRRPEYTGENRCWPCTVANLGVLGAVSILAGLAWPAAGVVVGLVGAVAIWFRGYLLPYTPRFAPRLARWLPITLHPPRAGDSLRSLRSSEGGEAAGESVLQTLVETGTVVVDGDRLRPSERFQSNWEEAMAELAAAPPSDLADAALAASTVAESSSAVDGSGRTFVVLRDGSGNVSWLHRPVAVAETAAAGVLAAAGVPADLRDVASHAVCAFLERCPACDAEIVETDAISCCGGTAPALTETPPRVLACPSCDVRFFTVEEP